MAKAAHYILAIDQGTTGTTVVLVDDKGKTVQKSSAEYRQIYPKPGWVEHSPEDIWKSVVAMIGQTLKKSRVKGAQIAAIGITNQRETVVLWERKSHKPVHNAIVWQDRRTSEACERLRAEGLSDMIRDRTGLVIDPYFSASKIQWLLTQVKGLRPKAENGKIAAGTIDTFLVWRLTSGLAHKTDVSNASRTMLMRLDEAAWDPELLNLFGVPAAVLPEITTSSGIFGYTKGLKILPDGIPIAGIAGDQQAALFGQACFEPGESKCTFGTGSFLLINCGGERLASRAGLLTTVAWQLKNESKPTYALEGGAFICGAAVQFLRDQLNFFKHSAEIEKLAVSVKDTGGVEFVPALTGLGAPHWDAEARGMICGLTRGTERAHIARATLEAMALQNAEILFAMQKDLRAELKAVRVDGGASANDLLMQLQADYLGVDVVRPKVIETTAAGAAYLAGLGVGLWKDTNEIRRIWKSDRVFQAKMTSEARARRLASWQQAVRRVRLSLPIPVTSR